VSASLTETLAWLVDIPSETGHESRICTALAQRLYPSQGLDGIDRIGDSLIAGRRTGRPLLVLAGHTDTVPSQGQGPARIEGGRLHGLGSADMKSGVAVMIHLLEDDEVRDGPYDLVGIFYAGEEGPAAGNELEKVLSNAVWLTNSEFAVVMEPSDAELQVGCNGVVNARLRFTGRSAHSARPWHGENAITKAGAFLAAMYERAPEPIEIDGLTFQEVFAVTKAAGGIASNIIPASFDVNLNYRFAPSRSVDEAIVHLQEVCAEADEIEIVDAAPAGPVKLDAPFFHRLAAITGAPRTAKQGWTDVARFGLHGIAAVNYGPGETSQAHQAGENVALADLERVFSELRTALTAE
jgi:succinyl-diaminopimelate desuccinylase